jgi:hypothetical protein
VRSLDKLKHVLPSRALGEMADVVNVLVGRIGEQAGVRNEA